MSVTTAKTGASDAQGKGDSSRSQTEGIAGEAQPTPLVQPRRSSLAQDDYISKNFMQLPPVSDRVRPAALQHAIRGRMVTSAELALTFVPLGVSGGSETQPAQVSENIQALGKALKAFEVAGSVSLARVEENAANLSEVPELAAALKERSAVLENATKETEQLNKQLEELKVTKFEPLQKYSHEQKIARLEAKINSLASLIDAASNYEETLTGIVPTAKSDPEFNKVKTFMTLDQSLMVKRRGISFADCNFQAYNDQTCKSSVLLEQGVASSVTLNTYEDGHKGVFKIDPERTDFIGERGAISAPKTLQMEKERPRIGNRNIATRVVADLLGSSVIPGACYALAGGQIGLLMDEALGKAPAKRKPWSKEKAQLHAQLNELQWVDLLTGQMDRHAGN